MMQESTEKPAEKILTIQAKKNHFMVPMPESVTCRIPSSTVLTSLPDTPSRFWVKNKEYSGYPAPSVYPEVTALAWNPVKPAFYRARTSVYQERTDYHTLFYPKEMNCLDTTITNRYPDSLHPVTPVLEWIQNEPVVILAANDGRIIAWQPVLSYIKWEKVLPVNENIVSTLATYQIHSKRYLLFTTDRNILYQLDLETGKEEKRIVLDDPVQSPIQVLESGQEIIIALKTKEHILCWEADHWQVLCKKPEKAMTDLSPFIIQAGQEKWIIQPFPSGRILSLSYDGETRWELNIQETISQDIALLVRDGLPWISFASASGKLLLIDAIHGVIHTKRTIPGSPVSPVVFESTPLSASVLVKTKSGAVHFFSCDLEETSRKDTEIVLPMEKPLAFFGVQTELEPFFCILNEKLEWMGVKKGMHQLSYPYPCALSTRIPDVSFLPRNPGVLVRGALCLNLGIDGFVMIGTPIGEDDFIRNEYRHKGTSFENSSSQPPYSNQSSRTSIDQLPDFTLRNSRSLTVPYHPFAQSLLQPVIWIDQPTGLQRTLISVAPDSLLILDDHLNTLLSLPLSYGTIYTEPMVENDSKGACTLWVLTEKALLKVDISSDYRQYTLQVLAEDVGSLGGSFLRSSRKNGYDLIWVDNFRQLTVFSMPKRQIRIKEPVNARNIAMHSWDGEKYLFCGSQVIRFEDGKVIHQHGIEGASSTVVAFQGRLNWIQSTEDDIFCFNGMKDEIFWQVRRLWCKSHCLFQSNAAVWFGLGEGRAIVSDFQRIISIDLTRGYIQWRYTDQTDIFLSQPIIIGDTSIKHVLAGSLRGKLYLLEGTSGELVRGFPLILPGDEEKKEIMKGASSPVFVNGLLCILRSEYGLIQFGKPTPSSEKLLPVHFRLQKKKDSEKTGYWIRSILYWEKAYTFSNRLKIE